MGGCTAVQTGGPDWDLGLALGAEGMAADGMAS